jgi:hypothetical protein
MNMRSIGGLVLAFAVVAGLASFAFPVGVSVAALDVGDVAKANAMAVRSMIHLSACCAAMTGAILFAAGVIEETIDPKRAAVTAAQNEIMKNAFRDQS